MTEVIVQPMLVVPPGTPQHEWEYDSNIDLTTHGGTRQMQVWRRPSLNWAGVHEFTTMENTPGRENRPRRDRGCWTSLEAFKRDYPHFERRS